MRALLFLLCMVVSACASRAPKSEVPAFGVAGVLVPTDQLAPPFVVEQRLHGKYREQEVTLDCVVQLVDGKLTVLGLTPFGTRAFVIEQQGTAVRFEKFVDRELPFQPSNVLYDLHRVFFRGLKGPQEDGVHEAQDHGDIVRELWQGGQLVERRFESLEGPISNLVVVNFEGAPAPIIAPRVRLTNVAFGYVLEIENGQQKALEAGYTLEVEQ